MTRQLLCAAAALAALAAPAQAQDTIPAPLPFGTAGAEVASLLEAREMRVLSRGSGRDVHAATADRRFQAVAVLAADSLVGLIYYHPETPHLNAMEVFTRVASGAELRFGPPTCRRSGLAAWPLEGGTLEVRLRGPNGDGAPGAEVRYLAFGYGAEMARRDAARQAARAQRPPAPERTPSGRVLLGVPAGEAPRAAPADPPAGDEPAAAVAEPVSSEAAARALCAA